MRFSVLAGQLGLRPAEAAVQTVSSRLRNTILRRLFVQRVLTVRGRKETSSDQELVVFYENSRDPLVNDALRDASDRLNRGKLERNGHRLRFAVDPPPATRERFD